MRKLFLATAVLSVLAASPVAAADTQTCATISKEQVSALFDRWNTALQTGNPDEIVKVYAEDAVLLPTVSNKPRTNRAEIREYFVHFMEGKPVGHIDTSTIRIGCNDVSNVGTYTFMLTDKEGKATPVAARYSFNYEFKDGNWLITHHHSSAMPEKGPAATH